MKFRALFVAVLLAIGAVGALVACGGPTDPMPQCELAVTPMEQILHVGESVRIIATGGQMHYRFRAEPPDRGDLELEQVNIARFTSRTAVYPPSVTYVTVEGCADPARTVAVRLYLVQ